MVDPFNPDTFYGENPYMKSSHIRLYSKRFSDEDKYNLMNKRNEFPYQSLDYCVDVDWDSIEHIKDFLRKERWYYSLSKRTKEKKMNISLWDETEFFAYFEHQRSSLLLSNDSANALFLISIGYEVY